MTNAADFELSNKLTELEKLMGGVTAWCQQHSISEETVYEVNLIVDEVVSNIIRHGFNDDKEHTIKFGLSLENDDLVMKVEDEGLHFNPLIIPPPDISRPMQERQPGGLGIFIVKKLTHDVQYRREGGRNFLVMRKRAAFD
jgi:anti-sigma regulatory factor (Ser/Thr protein kinase)